MLMSQLQKLELSQRLLTLASHLGGSISFFENGKKKNSFNFKPFHRKGCLSREMVIRLFSWLIKGVRHTKTATEPAFSNQFPFVELQFDSIFSNVLAGFSWVSCNHQSSSVLKPATTIKLGRFLKGLFKTIQIKYKGVNCRGAEKF